MMRRRADTLESYEGLPLDSPERRMIQNRNAQRVFRAKKINGASIGTRRPGQAPAQQAAVAPTSSGAIGKSSKSIPTLQPAEALRLGSTSVSVNTIPSPLPPLPESQSKSYEGTTTIGPFRPPKHFDLGDDDLISHMLADDPSCSTLDTSSTDVPRGVVSISLGEGCVIDAPIQFESVLPETVNSGPSQESSCSAAADITCFWGLGDFRSDFDPSYRAGEIAPSSGDTLTSMDAPTFENASDAAAAPQDFILPSSMPTGTLPPLPTLPITSYSTTSLQNCSTNTSGTFREDELRSGCVWRHPTHTATLHRLQVAEAKNELLESRIQIERERVARFREQAQHAQQLQQIQERVGRRRERSGDHYRNESRKRLNRPRTPKEQSVTNVESLNSWIRDCEEYIDAALCDFRTDIDMITWSASLLVQKRKDEWRTYADGLRNQGIEITWKTYCDYLMILLSNPETRNLVTEQKIERAKQRSQDTIVDFDNYLSKLYSELDYPYPEPRKMFNLRNNCDDRISSEAAVRVYEKPADYKALLRQYIAIEQHLRKSGTMPKYPSHDHRDWQNNKPWTRGHLSSRESCGALQARGRGGGSEGDVSDNASDGSRTSTSDSHKGNIRGISSRGRNYSRRKHAPAADKDPFCYGYQVYGHV